MAAITWRNIDAPSLGDPNRSLLSAQQGVNQAFLGLGDILKGYTANQEKNWGVVKDNNTEEFLAKAASQFATPEAFKAALASGQLDAQMQGYGGQIDKAAARQFLDTRQGVLQERKLVENRFTDAEQELRLRPQLQAVKMLAVTGKRGEVDAALQANPELMGRYGAELVKEGIVSDQQLKQFQFAVNRDAEAQKLAPVTLAKTQAEADAIPMNAQSQRISANASATSAGASVMNARTNQAQLNFQSGEALQKRLESLQETQYKLGASIASPEGNKMVLDGLASSIKDPTSLRKVQAVFGDIAADPKYKGLTPAAALQALVGSVDPSVWIFDRSGASAKARLDDIINSPDFQVQGERMKARSAELGTEINFLKSQIYPGQQAATTAAPMPGGTAGPAAPVAATPSAGANVLAQAAAALSGAKRADVARTQEAAGKMEVQLQKEQREILSVDAKGMPKRTAFSPEVEQYRKDKATAEAALTDRSADPKAMANELAQALRRTREQLGATGAEKKSPELTGQGATAAAKPTPLVPEPAKVKATTGVSLNISGSGVTSKPAAPVEIPADTKWGKKETVVQASPAAQIRNTGQKVVLSFVQDGDTATFDKRDGSQVNCRIETIEAPEIANPKRGKPVGQPYGEESKRTLQQMVENKEVTIKVVREDRDNKGVQRGNRNICQIEVEGKDVGLAMIQAGAAWAYRQYGFPIDAAAARAESEGKKAKRGLYANPNAVYPNEFKYPKQ